LSYGRAHQHQVDIADDLPAAGFIAGLATRHDPFDKLCLDGVQQHPPRSLPKKARQHVGGTCR
jgi:hypothetical protein